METKKKKIKSGDWTLFKSYYVVWKQKQTIDGNWSISEFKSYYVVWKPNLYTADDTATHEFKSYYVVWKHIYFRHILTGQRCGLNRTM